MNNPGFEVRVETEDGKRAKLAPGKVAALDLPIPKVLQGAALSRGKSFSFDRDTGRWIESGVATLSEGDETGAHYLGSSTLTSPWNNIDNPITTESSMNFVALPAVCANPPCLTPYPIGCYITASTTTGFFASGTTDANGSLCLLFPLGAKITVQMNPCNPISSQFGTPSTIYTAPTFPVGTKVCSNRLVCSADIYLATDQYELMTPRPRPCAAVRPATRYGSEVVSVGVPAS